MYCLQSTLQILDPRVSHGRSCKFHARSSQEGAPAPLSMAELKAQKTRQSKGVSVQPVVEQLSVSALRRVRRDRPNERTDGNSTDEDLQPPDVQAPARTRRRKMQGSSSAQLVDFCVTQAQGAEPVQGQGALPGLTEEEAEAKRRCVSWLPLNMALPMDCQK